MALFLAVAELKQTVQPKNCHKYKYESLPDFSDTKEARSQTSPQKFAF